MLSNVAPLKSSILAAAIIGAMVSGFYVYPLSKTWGFTFLVFFAILFVASLISMTYSPVLPEMDRKKK